MSDIDLDVYFENEFKDFGRLNSELEELDTLLKIDIVFIDSDTNKKLIENIEREWLNKRIN